LSNNYTLALVLIDRRTGKRSGDGVLRFFDLQKERRPSPETSRPMAQSVRTLPTPTTLKATSFKAYRRNSTRRSSCNVPA
jgi:hypothetical protein